MAVGVHLAHEHNLAAHRAALEWRNVRVVEVLRAEVVAGRRVARVQVAPEVRHGEVGAVVAPKVR